MTEKETYIPLSKILSNTNDKKTINTNIENLIKEDIPVYCRNEAAKKHRLISFKLLYNNNNKFWEQKGNWAYFLTKDGFDKLNISPAKVEPGYGSEYKTFAEMPVAQKVECLNKNKNKLDELAGKTHKENEQVVEALVDAVKDAALINRAILEDAMRLGDNEAKKLTQGLVDSTHEMVKSSTALITEDIFSNELMNTLVQKSNGTVIQHMTRSYLNGLAFLTYFNKLVLTSSFAQKIRVLFSEQYRKLYHSLLPHLHIDEIILERVFFGGLKAIPPVLLHNWAVGFLIHDVGKAASVEYHEGEAKYDRGIVIDHVKQGYRYAMTKTNYPMEANMIIGYHHEYYGDPAGYGYFRAYLQQYKKQNPNARLDYCITYEKEPVLDYHAFAYFPSKVLEIIDVYDSITDPNRVYRKAMEPNEALVMMREEFIEKQLKIDPILFDIFTDFIKEKHPHLFNQKQSQDLQDDEQDKQTTAYKDEQNMPDENELTAELERNAEILRQIMEERAKEKW